MEQDTEFQDEQRGQLVQVLLLLLVVSLRSNLSDVLVDFIVREVVVTWHVLQWINGSVVNMTHQRVILIAVVADLLLGHVESRTFLRLNVVRAVVVVVVVVLDNITVLVIHGDVAVGVSGGATVLVNHIILNAVHVSLSKSGWHIVGVVVAAAHGLADVVVGDNLDQEQSEQCHQTDTEGPWVVSKSAAQTWVTQAVRGRLQQVDESSSDDNTRTEELGDKEHPRGQVDKGVAGGLCC